MRTILTCIAACMLFVWPQATMANNPVKKGVVIIARGAPHQRWNNEIDALEKAVQVQIQQRGIADIAAVKVAYMQFNSPLVADVINAMECEGITEILALPLYTAPTNHSAVSIPNILGIASDAEVQKQLVSKGMKLSDSSVHIQLGPTLDQGTLLEEIMLDRVKPLIKGVDKEHLILFGLGNGENNAVWDKTMKRVGEYILAHTSLKEYSFAYMGHGMYFKEKAVPVIQKAVSQGHHVIVQSMYLRTGMGKLAKKYHADDLLNEEMITFDEKALLPDARVGMWMANRIEEWSKQLPTK